MIETGALEEVSALLARQLSPTLPVMRAIGVPEIAAYLRGELEPRREIAAGQLATRQYAKRQRTWFRGQQLASARERSARRRLADCLTRRRHGTGC